MSQTRSFNDKLMWFVSEKMAPVLGRLQELLLVRVIIGALTEMSSILIIASIFLLLAVYGGEIPGVGPKFSIVFSLTMGILSLYAATAIGISYAKLTNLSQLSGAMVGLSSFLLITLDNVTDNTISVASFGANGLFAAMVTSYLAMTIYRFCVEKKIVIRLPEGVPQGVANAFSALIPLTITTTLAWLVRSVAGFDLVTVLMNLLAPLFTAVDSIYIFTARIFVGMLLWSGGLHGEMMTSGAIFQPFTTAWLAENAQAAAAGVPATQLPHIWTEPLERIVLWPAAAWSLMILLYLSKAPHLRKFAVACTPAVIFTIIEPLVFGLPVVLNPYLIIPFVLSSTIAAIVSYGAMSLGLVAKTFATVPWSTPPIISSYIATGGDWRAVLLVLVNVLIGLVIYYPFFKVYEKKEIERMSQLDAKATS
ncbi:MAG TPA: PTS transporter subunit EIIC [Porticoccaceae bacterium]